MKYKTATAKPSNWGTSIQYYRWVLFLPLCVFALNVSCASTQVPASVDNQIRRNIETHNISLDKDLKTYFLEVAFGSEYSGGDGLVTWNQPVRIKIMGKYTRNDSLATLKVIEELNNILRSTQLSLVQQNHNISMLFTNKTGFKKNAPKYAWDNSGYFSIRWTPKEKHVTSGKILVNTEQSQQRRNHVIREEITQILGLMNDSEQNSESIFYQNYSSVTAYSSIDIRVLKLWDALNLLSGYKRKVVAKYLRELIQ